MGPVAPVVYCYYICKKCFNDHFSGKPALVDSQSLSIFTAQANTVHIMLNAQHGLNVVLHTLHMFSLL